MNMLKLTSLLLTCLPIWLFAQISITSGGKDVEVSQQTSNQDRLIDTVEMTIKNELSTSNGDNYGVELVDIFLQREGSRVNMSITYQGTKTPSSIIIERKSSGSLDSYRPIKVLSKQQINDLIAEGNLMLIDKYPESRRKDSYYRVHYRTVGNSDVMVPGVLLEGDMNHYTTYGDQEETEEYFEENIETDGIQYKDYGLTVIPARNGSVVEVTIKNSGMRYGNGSLILEKKGSSSTSTYRAVRKLDQDDANALNEGELVLIDKYPSGAKSASYYRLKIFTAAGTYDPLPTVILNRK